jgi:hypothetical protein
MRNEQEKKNGCSGKCDCNSGIARRDFLRITGAGSLALIASQLPVMAGPF